MTEQKPEQSSPDSHFTRGVSHETAEIALTFPYQWANRAELPAFRAAPGVMMQSLSGGALMANWVTIEPNTPIPRHQHPHEQIGIMLEGAMELTIGDETRLLRPGDAYSVPPHLPHGGRTYDEGCVVLDVFTPVREDYQALAKAAGETGE
jgi:quercetin dioxygenase-like cupin family protein